MPEFRFLTSSDCHLAEKPPGFRRPGYKDHILEKLIWQGEQAKKIKAHAVLRIGDFFNDKVSSRTTHDTVALSAKIHRDYPCETLSVVGNHDMSFNDVGTVDKQPLGVLYKAGIFGLVDKIYESGDFKVRVVGVDYMPDLDVEGLHDIVRKKDENITIAAVHLLAAMAPKEKIQSFFKEKIFDYRDLVFEGCPDVYVFGHYHKDQGIVEHMGVKFVNLGAVSRGALTFENLERKPKVSYIKVTPNGVNVEEIMVPHKDASEVFDLELKKRLVKERITINEFIQKYQEHKNLSSESSMQERLASLEKFPEDLRRVIMELMEIGAAEAEQD